VAESTDLGPSSLLYAAEVNAYNGPYDFHENFNRYVGVLKYTMGDDDDGLTVSGIGYEASGRSINQIPLRAVYQGLTSSLGSLDPTDFLTTERFTLNSQWWHRSEDGSLTKANVYGVYYSLGLFNDFTFFLQDPVHGDQIEQIDRRWITGGNVSHHWDDQLFGCEVVNTVGLQVRNDSIPHVGLHHTEERLLVNPIVDDSAQVFTTGVYASSQVKWAEKVRTVLGARGDYYHFDVDARDTPENTGKTEAKRFSPKGSLTLGPWNKTEFYLNGGYSYHTNDARGAIATIAPPFSPREQAAPQQPALPLVPSRGAEVGVRTQAITGLTSSVALWQLHLGQELEFDGDTGTTAPLRASDRYGLEWSNTYRINDWLTLDGDYAWSHGRLLGTDPTTPGNYIPESITTVFSGGPSVRLPSA
jgi:hypothetical protein